MKCERHSFDTEPRHQKPSHYEDCEVCKKAWDTHLRRQRWKRSERTVAKKLGTTRNPGSGAATPFNRGDSVQAGLVKEFFSHSEHRQRKNWAVWAWIKETEVEAKRMGVRYPLLTLAKPDNPGVWSVIALDYLVKLLEELSELRKIVGFSTKNGLVRRNGK